jgi:hypothetical protein
MTVVASYGNCNTPLLTKEYAFRTVRRAAYLCIERRAALTEEELQAT